MPLYTDGAGRYNLSLAFPYLMPAQYSVSNVFIGLSHHMTTRAQHLEPKNRVPDRKENAQTGMFSLF